MSGTKHRLPWHARAARVGETCSRDRRERFDRQLSLRSRPNIFYTSLSDESDDSISGMHDIRIGISGWRYGPWRGTFYPEDLVQRRELEYASRQVNSIEINGSFYSLQRPESYQQWYEQSP